MNEDSPCTRNCTLDKADICMGCGRTIGEIMEWFSASPARKREIKALLPERLGGKWHPDKRL